jgi:hypothetical protein
MLKAILAYHSLCRDLIGKGISIETILSLPLREELGRMKDFPAEGFRETAAALFAGIEAARRRIP